MAYTSIPPNGIGDTAGITLLFLSIFSLLLASIAIALRVWVRRMKRATLEFNDWLLFGAWVRRLSTPMEE